MTKHKKTRRFKAVFTLLLLIFICFFLILSIGCSRLKPDIIPDANAAYYSMNLGINVHFHPVGKKQSRENFKILLKYDDLRDKMLFLSPLNQVYGQLFIENEKVLLINSKKKKYWRGRFKTLIHELWALDFNYAEFKEMIAAGTIPSKKADERDLRIELEKEENSTSPVRIKIDYDDITLKIKISDRRSGLGFIEFSPQLEKMQNAALEEIFE